MKKQKFNTTTIMEPWYNKKRIWQCQWILSAMAYQQYSLFLIIDAPLWSPMWVIPLFSTHEALIIYDNILSPRYILSSTCWLPTQTLSDVWNTKVLLRESVNGGKLFSAKSDVSQPRDINLWGNDEDLPLGCMQNWRQCTQVHICL